MYVIFLHYKVCINCYFVNCCLVFPFPFYFLISLVLCGKINNFVSLTVEEDWAMVMVFLVIVDLSLEKLAQKDSMVFFVW